MHSGREALASDSVVVILAFKGEICDLEIFFNISASLIG
jgi:hypothetical protein